jgi:hypothetical protein
MFGSYYELQMDSESLWRNSWALIIRCMRHGAHDWATLQTLCCTSGIAISSSRRSEKPLESLGQLDMVMIRGVSPNQAGIWIWVEKG